ncbi:alpha/beta hydrolase [Rhodococcoides trifolii]|uniref:alpha/beta hydrolase n=1 Tax=Rhodococcoides trifolii TaxID=908250 RepID=UPI001664004B|nr:alpha/beta hydrolase [Rhodococcus trifolii]
MTTWTPDVLGDGYEQLTIPLGPDPDGEGNAEATLVRFRPDRTPAPSGKVVLYVHGFTDYFFQAHLAEHWAARGYRFYALDLRKCGRSLRAGQTPHFTTDLAFYDQELGRALEIVRDDTGSAEIVFMAHSTGGLIVPLWLDRLNAAPGGTAAAGIRGLVLNSPWFDLQGPPAIRSVGTSFIDVIGKARPTATVPGGGLDTYGVSIAAGSKGEWNYDMDWKPLAGFPIKFGWIRAVRRGHAALHRGLDIGVPSLILRSKVTRFSKKYVPEVDAADTVLDVRQIARWAGCLGDRSTIVPVEGARHDVFLSTKEPLARAFAELDSWLDWFESSSTATHSGGEHAEIRADA